MEFPKSYFEDEVRDGFYVPGMMKRAWASQLEILEDVDKVCKKHGIRYFAEYGTMLGTVRHGGYVPWDDDLDICMLREDYDKFLKVGLKDLPPIYKVLNFENYDEEEYICEDFLTRLVNGNQIRFDKEFLDKYHDFPYVAGLDIFPLDYMAPTDEEDRIQCTEVALLATMGSKILEMEEEDRNEYLKEIEKIYDMKFDMNKPLTNQLFLLADKVCARYSEKDSDYITAIALHTKGMDKMPKECYSDVVWMPFETTMMPVPIGYDALLKSRYGDYMKPYRAGGAHEYPFYKRQEQIWERNHPPVFKKYEFSETDLSKVKGMEDKTLKKNAMDMLDLFRVAHESIANAMIAEEYETAVRLLEDCQDGAIALGTKIEEVKGEGFTTVKVLEEYCEVLYSVHQAIFGERDMDLQTALRMLQESLCTIEQSVKKEIIERKIMAFLPYKASMWDSLESVWKAAVADPDCDTYVIPIPYYYKDVNGQLDSLHYEGDQFPDYVPITDYQEFDFGVERPDAIFIHNPYDEYNRVTSVHPFFYSTNLKKFTDKLVYIPYFVLEEIKPTDERAIKSLEHFAIMPGVINADVVIVQSEDMKESYVCALTEWAGEHTKDIWEKKIWGLGSPKYDKVLEDNQNMPVPEEWKKIIYTSNGKKKKVILYNIGLSALLEHKEAMITKIEDVFKVFKENQDEVALLWRPHPLIQATIQSMCPQLWEQYKSLVDTYCRENWGIYDDTSDLDRAIKISDAYYGDASSIIQLCRKVGMPTMVQNASILE